MRPRVSAAIFLAAAVLLLVVIVAGVTDAFGTGTQLQTNVGGWLSDGAAPDTFWDGSVIDVPGVAVTAVHCHGRVRYELQAGATGPSHDNPCYAAMGEYQLAGDGSPMSPFDSNGSQEWGVYLILPGNMAVYRISEGYMPWRYCIAGLIFADNGPDANLNPPPSKPC